MSYDITKCFGEACPIKAECYRFTSETLGRQDFFGSLPYNFETKECTVFWDNTSQIQVRAYQIWQEAGCPSNQALVHWQQAKSEILAEK